MSEQCFDSYVKTFENSLGNESQLILKEANINLNDTIYGEFIFYNLVKIKELALNGMAIYVELIDATCGKYDKGTDYDNVISVISGIIGIYQQVNSSPPESQEQMCLLLPSARLL